jgi:formylglycine-generating enzyme required for sulfatase activity
MVSTAPTSIFVSHSSQDNAWCRPFVAALQAQGFDVWYDEQGLTGGSAWVQTLQREAAARDVFVLVVTPESLGSQWCQEEIQLALATRRVILPVLHTPSKVEGFLLTRQWIDAAGAGPETAAERVSAALLHGAPPAQSKRERHPSALPNILPEWLARLGYRGWLYEQTPVITPPLITIPAGPFWMGNDPRRDALADEGDEPLHQVSVVAFQIARYPLTVAEYAWAIQAGVVPHPREWIKQTQRPHHPVTYTTWKNALTYTAWLADMTGEPWRVPTEAEWEKAARGTDGRVYPWGDTWDRTRANTEDGGPGDTTPVGMYPDGASPYGVMDMAGNVCEWVGTPASSLLARPGAFIGAAPDDKGYLAGGAWSERPANARCARRAQLYIGERDETSGIRLVLAQS